MSTQTSTTKTPVKQTNFTEQCRVMRKMQDLLEEKGTPLALAVFEKLEDTLNGVRVRYLPREKTLQEVVFMQAKFLLQKEDADLNLERLRDVSLMTTNVQHKVAVAMGGTQ